MKEIFHTLFLAIFSLSLYSQSGEIKGKILDSLYKEPLYNANVWVELGGNIIGTTTDFEGRFTIKPLPAGFYDLKVSYIGKKKYVLDNIRVSANQINVLKDILLADNSTLKLVEITVERYEDNERLIKADNTGQVTILQSDIKNNPNNKNPMTLLANSVPQIYQKREGQPLYFKGARNDAVQYYVDGVKTRNGNLGIPGSSIGEINVYTGGVPALYGDLTGGVVVIETKSFFEIYNQRNNITNNE